MDRCSHTSQTSPAILIFTLILHLLLQSRIVSASGVTTSSSLVVEFSLAATNVRACDTGLTNQGIYLLLEYREIAAEVGKGEFSPWKQLDTVSIPTQNISCRHNFSFVLILQRSEPIQFRLIQFEHGGGYCNCWGLIPNSWTVQLEGKVLQRLPTVNSSCGYLGSLQNGPNDCNKELDSEFFCSGSASIPRGFLSPLLYLGLNGVECPSELKEVVEQMGPPLMSQCSNVSEKIILSFIIEFLDGLNCDPPDSIDEGVELAIRSWTEKENWIPLRYFYVENSREKKISLGYISDASETPSVRCRGYDVPIEQLSTKTIELEICDPFYLKNKNIQFRWLQTSMFSISNHVPVDVWTLDNVTIEFVNGSFEETVLMETFDSEPLNERLWRTEVRNGAIENSTYCIWDTASVEGEENNALTFGQVKDTDDNIIKITSRLVTTAPLSFGEVDAETVDRATTNGTIEELVNNLELEDAIEYLSNVTQNKDSDISGGLLVDLLGQVLQRLGNRTGPESELQETTLQNFIGIGNNVIRITAEDEVGNTEGSVGSALLGAMDQFALQSITDDRELSVGNVTLITSRAQNTTLAVTFNSEKNGSLPGRTTTIEAPQEIMSFYAEHDGNENGTRAISFMYSNVNALFPVVDRNRTELASGVVSMAILCGDEICETNMLNLSSPVTITIEHSETNDSEEVICVFWNFDEKVERQYFRNGGHWSEEGCSRNVSLSSTSKTVCECTHLTHFAILLSSNPPELDPLVEFSLTVIGNIGTVVSLVAMTLAVFTFIILKVLHNIRNYIHVNLCINLGISQLIFVAGIDRTDPDSDVAPVHCQVIAILLHYFFLVSFMWMLMEGVVLYVVLMRVFAIHKKHNKYMLIFTLASYGLPFLYLGLLTLPLGFVLPNAPHYGYRYVCFLKTDSFFVWVFIGPVVLIFLANIGFFIMAASIMWRHQMEQSHQKRLQNICNWLKSAVSLSVIMGVTWVPCFLFVDMKFKELSQPLAYICTFLVAFQGVYIFLIFIVFSKAVREAYGKWWTTNVSESEVLSKYFGNTSSLSLSKKNGVSKNNNIQYSTSTKTLSPNSPSLLPPQPQHPPSTPTMDSQDSLDLVIPQNVQGGTLAGSHQWHSFTRQETQESVFQVIYMSPIANGETKDDSAKKGKGWKEKEQEE